MVIRNQLKPGHTAPREESRRTSQSVTHEYKTTYAYFQKIGAKAFSWILPITSVRFEAFCRREHRGWFYFRPSPKGRGNKLARSGHSYH